MMRNGRLRGSSSTGCNLASSAAAAESAGSDDAPGKLRNPVAVDVGDSATGGVAGAGALGAAGGAMRLGIPDNVPVLLGAGAAGGGGGTAGP